MEIFKSKVRGVYYKSIQLQYWIWSRIRPSKIKNAREIPIIINNYNRLYFLNRLIESLEKRGYTNIHILDNNSSYQPLLEYYKSTKYPVYQLNGNLGFMALWKSPALRRKFTQDFYVYTDPDVELVEECPDDFLEQIWQEMKQDALISKIGLSILINDLPDHYNLKQKVIEFEKPYFMEIAKPGYYLANVDTTFALHRPLAKIGANSYLKMYRSMFPLSIRHLPWYVHSDNLSIEEQFYFDNSKTITSWSSRMKERN